MRIATSAIQLKITKLSSSAWVRFTEAHPSLPSPDRASTTSPGAAASPELASTAAEVETSGVPPDPQTVPARVGQGELAHPPGHVGDRGHGKTRGREPCVPLVRVAGYGEATCAVARPVRPLLEIEVENARVGVLDEREIVVVAWTWKPAVS
jgi:hypothetical protein